MQRWHEGRRWSKRQKARFFFSVFVVLIIYLSREDDSRVNVVGSHDHIPLSLRAALCFLPWEVWRCILCVWWCVPSSHGNSDCDTHADLFLSHRRTLHRANPPETNTNCDREPLKCRGLPCGGQSVRSPCCECVNRRTVCPPQWHTICTHTHTLSRGQNRFVKQKIVHL